MPPLTRRTFLRAGATAVVAGGLGITADAAIWEPNHPRLVELEVALERLPAAWDGVRIAQLSDFHYDDHFSSIPLRRSINVVNGLRPDLLVLTGDFVTAPPFAHRERHRKEAAAAIDPCTELLLQMHAGVATFAVLGNHDVLVDPERIANRLQSCGIEVLQNRFVPLERGGSRLWIGGVEDVLEGDPDLDAALRAVPRGECTLLLAHEPDFALDVARYPVDLQLSGHSHGGQVRIPFVGAPWLPALGRRFPMGKYKLGKLTLYTNIGLGTVRVPVRWNCPPEITLLTLRKSLTPEK